MNKKVNTEKKLIDALDRLLAGESRLTDGRVTQGNIALEAGVSRATFNRYAKVVDEYRLAKTRKNTDALPVPFTIEEKNRELQESNIALRKKLTLEKVESNVQEARARQEIFVLTMALKAKDLNLAAKDREIAHLKRQLLKLQHGTGIPLHLVTSAKSEG